MRSKKFMSKAYRQSQHGFSLIELLVVSAIIGMISAVILYDYGDFSNVTLLRNQAYELALDIRQAQVFSISVRNQVDNADFKQEFGLHFNIGNNPTSYIFFRDADDDTVQPVVYDVGEELETVSLDSRFILKDICVTAGTADEICGIDGIDWVDISFKRPHFDATIVATGGGTYNSARIVIANARNTAATKSIVVSMTGLIEVKDQ